MGTQPRSELEALLTDTIVQLACIVMRARKLRVGDLAHPAAKHLEVYLFAAAGAARDIDAHLFDPAHECIELHPRRLAPLSSLPRSSAG